MSIEEFKDEVRSITNDEQKTVFIQKFFFNGTPFVFKERDAEHYHFKKRIADNFGIGYNDINIVGSSRFGFSPYKFTEFTYDSDIDVAICNETVFDRFFELICNYTYKIRSKEILLRQSQYKKYIKFLKYFSLGWIRPDLLPHNTTEFKEIRDSWDEFFKQISYGNSEVGNYEVKAGLFKNQAYAERYYTQSIKELQLKLNN